MTDVVLITKRTHPNYRQRGIVIEKDAQMFIGNVFCGIADKIKNEAGEEFFAGGRDYRIIHKLN